ncbi:MAG: DNA repair protein RadA [Clostridia bacterium]|nr:DNA repair protein RadA [Clostridia bacterium]
MKNNKTVFECAECGASFSKWFGKCTVCGAWNSAVEAEKELEKAEKAAKIKRVAPVYENEIVKFDEYEVGDTARELTGMGELDRVLGGGLVAGSVVLLAGEPGIGKSTLLLQICKTLASGGRKVLYVSGEESRDQIKLRAKRLEGVEDAKSLYLLTDTNVSGIIEKADKLSPDIMIIDSIQTIYSEAVASAPGSIAQVRECALSFINKAKNEGISIILVGHVNKEGSIAGPKVLEHMVDAVLYFEGEKIRSYRMIRAIKNRYGSTNEIGLFEMTDSGLAEVPNPSEMLLSDRREGVSGSCAVCVVEGTRPVIAEIQALVTSTAFPSPRRTSNGVDYNRACLLIAVLEKRLGFKFYTSDVYLNVIGGLRLDEPASDLAVALALISGIRDLPVESGLIAIGEVGLSGEVRAVSEIEKRISEASRLGFTKILLPYRNMEKLKGKKYGNVELIPVKSIFEALPYVK